MTENPSAAKLREMVRTAIAFGKTGTIPLAPSVMTIPASNYTDPQRFQLEVDRIFKRVPLMLATTAEIPGPGDYKTLEAAGVPVLIQRGHDGVVRALINSCSHRGANVATAESGNARRFTCPYHGWSFAQTGELIAVASADEFGEIDKACYSLKTLPVTERAGLIWVVLDPKSQVDFDAFLGGYDALLERFGFKSWHFFSKRTLKGPNWKIAYDGYLDYYHLPVLHRATFGPDMLNQAIYFAWGPHQRVQAPMRNFAPVEAMPEDKWSERTLLDGVWTIFPHISIASFGGPGGVGGGGRGVMISMLLPGETVDESYTTQLYLLQDRPEGAAVQEAHDQFEFLRRVVEEEDYTTGVAQQRALKAGGVDKVTFGRNETGAQCFHGWVDKLIAAKDEELNGLFRG